MKRLMSDEEFRRKLEEAFDAGWTEGSENSGYYYTAYDFDGWYEEVYGGPDCE